MHIILHFFKFLFQNFPRKSLSDTNVYLQLKRFVWSQLPVKGLYCKRPIQCLASSEILTPHPPAGVYPPSAFDAEGGHTRWVERGLGGGSIVRNFGRRQTLLCTLYTKVLCGLTTSVSLSTDQLLCQSGLSSLSYDLKKNYLYVKI